MLNKLFDKKNFRTLFIAIIIIILLRLAASGFCYIITPSLTIDFSAQSELTGRASGFLYGFAEDNIPSSGIAESMGITALATKTAGGLQHPVGDVRNVADTFLGAGGEMLMVYTQDMYDTWYYQLDSLEEYNEKVRTTVTEMEKSDYKDNLVYCIYNEMDNGAWLGSFWEEENRYKFYDAWKDTFEVVKAINPEAKIAGPGHCGYNYDFIKEFLSYCKENDCLPEVVVWHELSDRSIYNMEHNFNGYYSICDELDIDRLPVCISEYGLMRTNGIPSESVKWISRLEKQDAYGCVAYWRLANNLSDCVADDVMPNANYWVYNFYASMKGKELDVKEWDILHSNVENYLKGKEPLMNKGFIGLASFSEDEEKIYIMTSGENIDSKVRIKNLSESIFPNGEKLTVKISSVSFNGLGGEVISPVTECIREVTVRGNYVYFEIPCSTEDQAFFIEITKGETENYVRIPYELRKEAEDMELGGEAAVTDALAYSASEGKAVTGLTRNASALFTVSPLREGTYDVRLVYGNGSIENTRISAELSLCINGQNYYVKCPPTLKWDNMESVSAQVELKKGKNEIVITNVSDVPVTLDFVRFESKTEKDIYVKRLTSRNADENENSYSVIIPRDGYYRLEGVSQGEISVNSKEYKNTENGVFYFSRGYNKITLAEGREITSVTAVDKDDIIILKPDDVTLLGDACVSEDENTSSGRKIGWISSDAFSGIIMNVKADREGYYAFTVEYANNEEGGFHDYNVDLIERYISVSVNGEKTGNFFFRSTYSWDCYKTTTIVLYLNEGENQISFTNDGSYSFNNRVTYAPDIGSIKVNYCG